MESSSTINKYEQWFTLYFTDFVGVGGPRWEAAAPPLNMPTAYYSCKKEHWTDYTFQTERKRLGLRDGVRTHVRNIFRVQKTSKVFFFFILSSLILLNFLNIYEPILSYSYCIYFPITYHIQNLQFSITASKIQSSPLYSPLSVAAITLLESDAFCLFSPLYS